MMGANQNSSKWLVDDTPVKPYEVSESKAMSTLVKSFNENKRELFTQPFQATQSKGGKQNPFTNQRARNKWNKFIADEYGASPEKISATNPFIR